MLDIKEKTILSLFLKINEKTLPKWNKLFILFSWLYIPKENSSVPEPVIRKTMPKTQVAFLISARSCRE